MNDSSHPENHCACPASEMALSSWTYAVFSGLALFFAITQVLLITTGLLRIGMTTFRAWLILVVAAALSVYFGRSLRRADHRAWGRPRSPSPPANFFGHAVGALIVLAILVALVIHVWCWILAALVPPHHYDSLAYHIPAIHGWVQAGRISWVPASNPLADGFPKAIEAFSFLMYYALATDLLVNSANLWFVPLGVLGMVLLSKSLGVRGRWAWLTGALFLIVPIHLAQASACYVDIAFSSAVVGMFAVTSLMIQKRQPIGWRDTLIWGSLAGLMMGAKGTGAPFSVLCGMALAWIVFTRRGPRPWQRRLACLTIAAFVAGTVGSYWYVRNYIYTRNPLYPVEVTVGSRVIFPGRKDVLWSWRENVLSHAPDSRLMLEWPPQLAFLLTWTQMRGSLDSLFGGLGFLWPAGALPAVIYVWLAPRYRRIARHRRALIVLTLLTAAMFVVQPERWWSRLTTWLYALGLPCFALAFQDAYAPNAGRRRWPALVLYGLALTYVCLVEGAVLSVNSWRGYRYLRLVTGSETCVVRPHPAITFGSLAGTVFDEVVASEKVALVSGLHGYAALLEGFLGTPIGARHIEILPASPTESDIRRIKDMGIRWVLVQPDPPPLLRRHALEIHKLSLGPAGVFVNVIQLPLPAKSTAPEHHASARIECRQ